MIQVQAPDGSIVEFPDGTPDDVMARAMRATFGGAANAPTPPTVGAAEAATRGAAQGFTSGFGDEMAGAAAASPLPFSGAGKTTLGNMGAPDVIAGGARLLAQRLAPGVFGTGATGEYQSERDRVRQGNTQAQAQRPITFGAGQIGGAVAGTMPLAGAIGQGASLAGNVVRGGLTGAALGGAQGAGEAPEMADVAGDAARGAGIGLAVGGLAPAVIAGARRAISPLSATPERQALVKALQREGVDLTAGQRTGSKPLMWAESTFGDMPIAGGRAAEIQNRQGQQFTQAAMKRAGSTASLATPEAIDDAFSRLGQRFDDLASRNTLKMDAKFAQDIGDAVQDYVQVVNPSMRAPIVDNVVQDIIEASKSGGFQGAAYQNLRSRLEKIARTTQDSDLAGVLRSVRSALDDAMERSIPAGSPDRGAWGEVRRQYRNLIPIEKAATGAGERAAEGYISPALLRTAVKQQSGRAYARGQGDLAELARAGTVMNPLPQSGTAPRALIQTLATGGGVLSGDPTTLAASVVGPALLGRVLLSRPVQSYLGNQAASGPMNRQTQKLLEVLLATPSRQLAISRD
jgi:hypothetical protein